MSDIWLPNTPAFEGLIPHEVIWQPLENAQADKIRQACGFEGRVERMVNHQAWPKGYYRVLGQPSYFVKVTEEAHALRQLEADDIAEYLQGCEVSVNRLLQGFPKAAKVLGDSTLSLLAYDYLHANFIKPSCQVMTRVGEAIAYLHLALSEAPFAEQVKSRGLKRHQALIRKWQNRSLLQVDDLDARDILDKADESLLMLLVEDAQCVHGDLNFGNIMMDANDKVVFLDFEDAQSAWFNPLKDLAFVIERFILIHEPQDMDQQLTALLTSYYKVYPKSFSHAGHLVGFLQALAVRSLLILAEAAEQGYSLPPSEWKKFVFLYKLAQQKKTHLDRIFKKI